MLIALKAITPHGEFTKRCAEAFKGHSVNVFSEEEIHAAKNRAGNYMRLATPAGLRVWCLKSPHALPEWRPEPPPPPKPEANSTRARQVRGSRY